MSAEIITEALNTFQKNLLFLERNYPELYERINLLNLLIEAEEYIERYALEYKEEGYFDVLELSSNELLYKENSYEHAKRVTEGVNFKRTGGIFYAQRLAAATDEQAEYIDKSELSFHNVLWATIKIINYVKRYTSYETYMQSVDKIIFIGIGLGLYVESIADKLKSQVVFIKEKNLEIFRLSLFVTDYEKLAVNRYLYFSITDDTEKERENFMPFLHKGNNHNLYMKFIPFTLDYEEEVKRLQTHVFSQSYINYGYSPMLLRYIDSPRYLIREYSFLNIGRYYVDNLFSKKPVLLLFSGPSTLKNIRWVQENSDRFIIVSALSTCRLLSSYNISPDVVMHIDPGENTAALFEGLDIAEYFKNTVVILSANVDEATVQKFDKKSIHFIDQGTHYKRGFGTLSAPSVGEYTYALFLILGAANMFLLGIDMALDSETLQSHGDFHPDQFTGKVDKENASLEASEAIEFVPGNFLEQVPTLAAYKLSIWQLEMFTDKFKQDYHRIYNLSNGALLQGCEPLRIGEYDWGQWNVLDKKEIHQPLKDFFQSIGSTEFNEEDKGWIKYQIKTAKALEKIIKQHQKKKFAHPEAYLNSLTKLSIELSDMDYKTNSNLAQVYYEYFLIVLSYIYALFNTQELSNPNKHVVQMHRMLDDQLLKISKTYLSKMESYLE
ncbi:protein of unknown function DUF115 [Sulfuricurvum kujiense DSM 16994]|uniref:DUF115 domain-containing protein n=1 Tax=Sulfuricurvum kujiense (strain ATCC BAA-921 / DSM 16994 / JCM 11577 / YK-1) TaxID=709032 RepID=E4TXD3_SULKY|nr:6-hydroxymethylpterin diphosphokinase MptE-like protein [Sulfuricurvum kujiense]ADR32830.1 protein of unknown function DUF115 [Sulfuricurvum kujiense DSM 16994]